MRSKTLAGIEFKPKVDDASDIETRINKMLGVEATKPVGRTSRRKQLWEFGNTEQNDQAEHETLPIYKNLFNRTITTAWIKARQEQFEELNETPEPLILTATKYDNMTPIVDISNINQTLQSADPDALNEQKTSSPKRKKWVQNSNTTMDLKEERKPIQPINKIRNSTGFIDAIQGVVVTEQPEEPIQMVECPNCQRTFNSKAAKRHIPQCKGDNKLKPGDGMKRINSKEYSQVHASETSKTKDSEFKKV